jgi:MFS superfamily sulfate permease-like transporter
MGLVLIFFTGPLAYVPTASLGAVLVLAGISLFDFESVWKMRDISRSEFALSLIATLGVATVGVLPGIAFTVILSLILLIRRASVPYDAILGEVPGVDGFTDISEYPDAQTIRGLLIYRFDAALLFFNADYFKKRVREVVASSDHSLHLFVFDMEAINVIDMTGLEAVEEIRSELASKGIAFAVARAKVEVREKLSRAGYWDRIGATNFHPSVRSAVQSGLNEHTGKSDGSQ